MPVLAGDAGDVPAEEGRARPKTSGRSRVRLPWTLIRPSAIYISGEVIESDVPWRLLQARRQASSSAAEVRLHSCLLPAARSWGR